MQGKTRPSVRQEVGLSPAGVKSETTQDSIEAVYTRLWISTGLRLCCTGFDHRAIRAWETLFPFEEERQFPPPWLWCLAQSSLHLLSQADGCPSLFQSCIDDHLWGEQANEKPANFAPFLAAASVMFRDVEMGRSPKTKGEGDQTGRYDAPGPTGIRFSLPICSRYDGTVSERAESHLPKFRGLHKR